MSLFQIVWSTLIAVSATVLPSAYCQQAQTPSFSEIEGRYERKKPANDWHVGEIVSVGDDSFEWRNKAGIIWKLTPNLGERQLMKPPKSNNYDRPNGKAFRLTMKAGKVTGFRHLGQRYVRLGDLAPPKADSQNSDGVYAQLIRHTQVALLIFDEVRHDIGFTKKQEAEYVKLRDQFHEAQEAEQDKIFEQLEKNPDADIEKLSAERELRVEELEREFHKQELASIQPEQMIRLEQIAMQKFGVLGAFKLAYIKQKLVITQEQAKRIAGILEALEETTDRVAKKYPSSDDASLKSTRREFRVAEQAAAKDVLGVLTDRQTKIFDEIRGTPFQFPADVGNYP